MNFIQIIVCPNGSSFEVESYEREMTRTYFSSHSCSRCRLILEDEGCPAYVLKETKGIGMLLLEDEQTQDF